MYICSENKFIEMDYSNFNHVDSVVLEGVGKKMRSGFLAGKVSEGEVMDMYRRNCRDAERFDPFGWSMNELVLEEGSTHNPVLRARIHALIEEQKAKSEHSKAQNALSLEKLGYYSDSALGIGIRPVMKAVEGTARQGDDEARILLLLMQTEFANLHAKKSRVNSKVIYQRKDCLLRQVSDLLYDYGWKCGISTVTGKNASYIVYVYLPDGNQISWHCNDYDMYSYYDDIDCTWDGQACSTMEKLLSYAHDRYGIGTPLKKYESNYAA